MSYISLRYLQFLLHEVLDASALRSYEAFAGYDAEAYDMTLDAAKQLADAYLYPIFREMDQKRAFFQEGKAWVHPGLRTAMEALGNGGWIAAPDEPAFGGQNMPYTLANAALLIFYAANGNAASYAFLTQGAARLIRSFGDKTLQDTYVSHMYKGNWQGTMALTEPQAGSSLTDVVTVAEPTQNGYYLLKGQKIFISGGDHTAVDNIVHLMLARIKGAPAGTKGISLFVVPKYRPEDDQLVPNDVTTAGIFGKMGQKGYVAAHLMLGENNDCRGYLIGEPHKGLSYMFQMMNEARIGTGIMAIATASAAYYAALQYARERPQGRHPSNKDPNEPQILIIEHADVRRMLLFQKAIVEGSIAFLLKCSLYSDLAHISTGEGKENYHLLLELLTPIAKSYPSEMSIQAVSAGMQCLGGAGYCDDFPLEQYYRDVRVNAIYEGTTTIHGIDLLGRKVLMNNGKAFNLFISEVESVIGNARKTASLNPYCNQLEGALEDLKIVTDHLTQKALKDTPEVFLADATLYLELFSLIGIGWQWLEQAQIAARVMEETPGVDTDFYQGRIFTCNYFFEYELPKIQALKQRLLSADQVTLNIKDAYFD